MPYNPAADEESLDRCVQRLQDIAEESGRIGVFLEQTQRLDPGPNFDRQLENGVERNRVPGFCGHQLLIESQILIELIAVRVAVLHKAFEERNNKSKLAKLDKIEAFCEGLEPILSAAMDSMSAFNSLNGIDQLSAIIARGRRKKAGGV